MIMNEIISKRGMYEKHFFLGQGKYQANISSYPLHYKDSNDKWEEISTDIIDFSKWEFKKGVLSNSFRTYFGDDTDNINKHLVSVEYIRENKEKWFNFKLENATPTFMEVNKSKCVFKHCFSNIDLEYIVMPGLLKENISLSGVIILQTIGQVLLNITIVIYKFQYQVVVKLIAFIEQLLKQILILKIIQLRHLIY